MRALLSVGQGSYSPTKLVVMQWNGGAKDVSPLALVGKGVVIYTGGISLKPAFGMEAMTMDMARARVFAGVMKTLAMRKAQTNVVGLVGLMENMPLETTPLTRRCGAIDKRGHDRNRKHRCRGTASFG